MERQARRAQVLRHAKRIFARKGYHRTNVADIISRARIARGTFYLYFQNKKDLFEELLAQVLTELSHRIQRLRVGPDEPDPIDQLRNNLRRVLNFVLAERELTDILLNHSVGFDRELDLRILEFYERIADAIQRSLDLGIQMSLVRTCDTRMAAYCILGGIKEVVGQIARRRPRSIDAVVEEILAFGLGGVARPELLESMRRRSQSSTAERLVFGPKVD
ncbi:MAG TPA: helix-turn-helix domain-containing protein [Candidatus Binataceae bacterium]|jgi:AcrR family transcriptional regulator|nr:helix-turn-helix domain-containing protein [Candidatus Binataceae bacterium]